MAAGHQLGGLEVVVGSMFSGKSEELIRRVKRAVIARRTVQVFKPAIDDRFGAELVRSHDGDSFVARPVRSSAEVAALVSPETSVVGIDEVQFFDAGIVGVVRDLVARTHRAGDERIAIVRSNELAAETVVDRRLEHLDGPAGDDRALHAADELFALPAEHAPDDDLQATSVVAGGRAGANASERPRKRPAAPPSAARIAC